MFEIIALMFVVVKANGVYLAKREIIRELRMVLGKAANVLAVAGVALGIFNGDE